MAGMTHTVHRLMRLACDFCLGLCSPDVHLQMCMPAWLIIDALQTRTTLFSIKVTVVSIGALWLIYTKSCWSFVTTWLGVPSFPLIALSFCARVYAFTGWLKDCCFKRPSSSKRTGQAAACSNLTVSSPLKLCCPVRSQEGRALPCLFWGSAD